MKSASGLIFSVCIWKPPHKAKGYAISQGDTASSSQNHRIDDQRDMVGLIWWTKLVLTSGDTCDDYTIHSLFLNSILTSNRRTSACNRYAGPTLDKGRRWPELQHKNSFCQEKACFRTAFMQVSHLNAGECSNFRRKLLELSRQRMIHSSDSRRCIGHRWQAWFAIHERLLFRCDVSVQTAENTRQAQRTWCLIHQCLCLVILELTAFVN